MALTVLSSMATRQILAALIDDASTRGSITNLTSVGGVEAAKRIRAGEGFDIVVLAADALQALADEGFLRPDSIRVFACSPTAVAVAAGAPRPTVCDEAAVRALVAGAKRIAISTGPSGQSIERLLRGWGEPDLAARLKTAPPGVPVARLIAQGEAEIGFQQLSELRGEAGIAIVGKVPVHLQPMTVFSAGIGSRVADLAAAERLLRMFLSADATAVKQVHGMEPGALAS